MPTNGFCIIPLEVKLLGGEQKATEFASGGRILSSPVNPGTPGGPGGGVPRAPGHVAIGEPRTATFARGVWLSSMC